MMEVLGTIAEWINDPLHKTVLGVVGGFIFANFTDVVNKFIPIALLGLSTLTTTLQALFPSAGAAEVITATYAAMPVVNEVHYHAVGFFSSFGKLGGWVVSAVIPVAIAVGTHSSAKNTRQWWGAGKVIFDATQNPSKQAAKKPAEK